MTKLKHPKPIFDSDEERELFENVERGEWVSVGDLEERKKHWKKVAENTIASKRKRISLSMDENVLMRIKAKAMELGMPYQTYINSVMHQVVSS